MIDVAYPRMMARYNRWQNRSLYAAASTLDDTARKADRQAFFGSIHGTLNHLLWADQNWMRRFADTPPPRAQSLRDSVSMCESWDQLKSERAAFDRVIERWADGLRPEELEGDLTYFSATAGRTITKSRPMLVVHMFNHQTHHRGQVHCMLTQCGASPEDTDLPLLPA